MKIKKIAVLVGMGVAFSGVNAFADTPWIGTANYGVETVGPFNTYDLARGVVLLEPTSSSGNTTNYNGFYQAYVVEHQDVNGEGVDPYNSLLNQGGQVNGYELTAQATFTESAITNGNHADITVNAGGSFMLYLDKSIYAKPANKYNYAGDSGFNNGTVILEGKILGGVGSADLNGSVLSGYTDLTIEVIDFDQNVFNPDTIVAGESIFTLRFGRSSDTTFLSNINSVMGNAYGGQDMKLAADGNIALAVPEAETWAMMLAGLGLVGLQLRRKGKVTKEIAVN